MPIRSFIIIFLITWIGVVPGTSAPALDQDAQKRFEGKLPKLFEKLRARDQVHVSFIGDPLFLNAEDSSSLVQTFLRKLEELFFYTGGTHELYDPNHLQEDRPKITYECCPSDAPDPGALQLMQYVTTVGLLNEPDLVILCAGPGDTATGIDLDTQIRTFEKLRTTIQSASDLIVLGPRAFRFNQTTLELNLEARAQTVVLEAWARESDVPFHDPNPQLFPRNVLFNGQDDAQTIWNAFLSETVDWIQGQDRAAAIDKRRQQAVAKALFKSLTAAPSPPLYQVDTKPGAKVTVALKHLGKVRHGGLIVPSLANQRDGIRFQPTDAVPSFQIEPQDSPTYRGRLPCSFLVVDDRRVEWINVRAPLGFLGLEWLSHAEHNNKGSVAVNARLHPYEGAPDRVPYQISFGNNQRRRGTATFVNGRPADIKWSIDLPSAEQQVFQEKLAIRLGENGEFSTITRQLDAIRQFPLNREVPLHWVNPGNVAEPKNEDLLVLGNPEATLTVEASADDLSIHVDLKNLELVEAGEEPAVQLALTLDGRSFEKLGTLGYAGTLFITAGPGDGPATVSPFAQRAHFGNGYARRPLVPGRQARLSTRPNGIRRITIQMVKEYFYLRKWVVDNWNSELGIGLSLAIARKGDTPAWHYVLQETPHDPNNCEDLAVVELDDKGTNRWCVKWNP